MPTAAALHRARALVELRRWPEAAAALQPALADPQAGPDPWCLLAQCQLSMGKQRDAERSARRAIATDPGEEWGHRLLAIALSQRGRRRAAVRSCRTALELEPEQPLGLHLLTTLRIAQGRRREAERVAAANLRLNPDRALAWEGASDAALARRRWTDAERYARHGLQLDPQDADLAMNLGRALAKQGRNAEAGEAYAAAARSDPTDNRPRRAPGRLGLPAVGIGLVSIKLLPFVLFQLAKAGVLVIALPSRVIAPILAALLAGSYGIGELLHRRARRQLDPALRAIAVRQRRESARGWLLAAGVLTGLLAVRACYDTDWTTGSVLAGVLAAEVVLYRRLPRPVPSTVPGAGRFQSIRRRFR